MREIKFRGKCSQSKRWVYGWLLTNKLGTYIVTEENPHECTQNHYIEIDEYCRVVPETVGQYTGLKDKNGTEIYEGDIVSPSNSWNPELKFVVTFGEGVFDSGYYSFTGFYLISDDGRQGEDQYELSKDSVYEIIGNIHDNPELLGGAG